MSSGSPLLTSLLKSVSRSFYLTLRFLPAPVRPQIGLSYLLARTTDTIADTEIVPPDQRLHLLHLMRERIDNRHQNPLNFTELIPHQGSPGERALLEHTEEAFTLLNTFSEYDRHQIREVLHIITGGQELDLQRFAKSSATNIVALQSDYDLDDYTYRVAGCVGGFWTKMCRCHLFPNASINNSFLLENGIRFGKGLQLINILRDIPSDLRQGRCYLPEPRLKQLDLSPSDLLDPKNEPRLRPLYNEYLKHAEEHLAAGWLYTNTLPRGCVRVRLACAWPILIGMKTLEKLKNSNVLDPAQRIKISRAEVRSILFRSILAYPSRKAWNKLFPASATEGNLLRNHPLLGK